tara:strand:- start:24560 stop:24745 length:186 start_codon:yes stop_codon:yes gene_type:complete
LDPLGIFILQSFLAEVAAIYSGLIENREYNNQETIPLNLESEDKVFAEEKPDRNDCKDCST